MSRPNIVFIIADQHRWDFIGYEDGGRTHTPSLDALGQRGTVFHSAHCTAPLCSPSRIAIASGRYAMNSGCFTNLHQLPPGTPTWVSQLRAGGYYTSAVGKTHMEIHAYDSDLTSFAHRQFMDMLGWDEVREVSGNGMMRSGIRCFYSQYLREQGLFDEALDFYANWHYFLDPPEKGDSNFCPHVWPLAEEHQETTWIGRMACEWIEGYKGNAPFVLHVGFAGPHSPIEPNERFLERYRDQDEPPPYHNPEPAPFVADGRRGYRAMISQIDHQVGNIMAALERRGMLQNTIVLYLADHGEMAGDQGLYQKTTFYEASVRVPLVIAGPGLRTGHATDALVELIDLGSTLCELTGVSKHALDQGQSLVPLLSGQTNTHRNSVYCEMGCDKMVRNERFKLMWGEPTKDTRQMGRLHLNKPVDIPASPPRLYDLWEDPHEEHDLASDPAAQSVLQSMMALLLERVNANTQMQPFLDRGEYRPLR